MKAYTSSTKEPIEFSSKSDYQVNAHYASVSLNFLTNTDSISYFVKSFSLIDLDNVGRDLS